MTTADPVRGFDHFPPAELTPAERTSAVAALLAAGLLRALRPEHFPPSVPRQNLQEISGEST